MNKQRINQSGCLSKIKALVPGVCLIFLLITACTSQARAIQPSPIEPLTLSHGKEIGGYVELVDALRAQNADVQPLDVIKPSFFEVQGQLITINGVEVQAFEFADESAREAAAARISPDGSSIGTTMITWIDQPNFWAKGRVVVLYVGQEASIIEMLTAVLGAPIVQGQPVDQGQPVVQGEPAPAQSSLNNTKWELYSFGWPGAHTGVPATYVIDGTTVTLEFGVLGRAGGLGGCNSFSAYYEWQGNMLTISEIISTLFACDAPGVNQQEQRYFQALKTARQFEQAEDHLVIWYGDGQDVLFFFPWREATSTPAATSMPCATAQPTSAPTPPANQPPFTPERIAFETGATSAIVRGNLQASGSGFYVLRALRGQTMTVELSFTEGQAILAIWGKDGTVLLSDHAEAPHFQGVLPSTQDYFILLKGRPDGSTSYIMKISIPPL